MEEIDFVIPWVDGNDPEWQKEFSKYRRENNLEDTGVSRYRDWSILHYWFRSVEKYAPWVRKIHFVTWGHIPAWLNTAHPKLHVVKHQDYMPADYMPTFSANPIELNLHRIDDLKEKFVYFNDDFFLLRETRPSYFFRKGLPCDIARLSIIQNNSIDHIIMNDLAIIRHYFSPHQVIKSHVGQWLNLNYKLTDILKTLTLLPWSVFPGFKDTHMPQPFLKSTFQELWEKEYDVLDQTSRTKFRSLTDVNQYLMRYWALSKGIFVPKSFSDTKLYTLSDDTIDSIAMDVSSQKYHMICLNDSSDINNVAVVRNKLIAAFDSILGEKSGYEL